MAKQPVDYQGGRPVYNNASPGIGGAIKDAIGAISSAIAPKSVTQIKQREQSQEDESDPTGRMRSAQSTDNDNAYNY